MFNAFSLLLNANQKKASTKIDVSVPPPFEMNPIENKIYDLFLCCFKNDDLDLEKEFLEILFETKDYSDTIREINSKNDSKKGYCGKILKTKDVGFKCLECEMDPTCIICQDCFEKGNHKGHRIIPQVGCTGCCDCGDPEAWKPSGFCSEHSGTQDLPVISQELPEKFRERFLKVYRAAWFFWLFYCEKFYIKNSKIEVEDRINKIFNMLITTFYVINKNNIAICLLIFELLRNSLNEKKYNLCHNCEDLETFELNEKEKLCECSILELIMRFNQFVNANSQKILSDFCISLFTIYDFKKYLILTYTKMFYFFFTDNYQNIFQINNYSRIVDLEYQIFTSEELPIETINSKYFPHILQNIQDHLISKLEDNASSLHFQTLYYLFNHFSHLCEKAGTALEIAKNDNIMNHFFETAAVLQFRPAFPKKFNAKKVVNQEIIIETIETEKFFLKSLKNILSFLNEKPIEFRNNLLEKWLAKLIEFIQKHMDSKLPNHYSFHIPLHRMFSLIVLTFYSIDSFDKILSLLKNIFEKNTIIEHFDDFLLRLIIPPLECISSCRAIERKLWINYGESITIYTRNYFRIPYNLFNYDYSLFAIIFPFLDSELKRNIILKTILHQDEQLILLYKFYEKKNNNKAEKLIEKMTNSDKSILSKKILFLADILLFIEYSSNGLISLTNASFKINQKNDLYLKNTAKVVLRSVLKAYGNLSMKKIKEMVSEKILKVPVEDVIDLIATFNKTQKTFTLSKEELENYIFDPFLHYLDPTIGIEEFTKVSKEFEKNTNMELIFGENSKELNYPGKIILEQKVFKLAYNFLSFFFETGKKYMKEILDINGQQLLKIFLRINYKNVKLTENKNYENFDFAIKFKDFIKNNYNLDENNIITNSLKNYENLLSENPIKPQHVEKLFLDKSKSEMDLKKKEIQEKKSKMLLLFQEKQKAFLKKNENLLKNNENLKIDEEDYCVICKEPEGKLGLVCHFTKCNLVETAQTQRLAKFMDKKLYEIILPEKIGFEKQKSILEFETEEDFEKEFDLEESEIFNKEADFLKQECNEGGFVITSCHHSIHIKCFIAYTETKKYFSKNPLEILCPLCNRLSNCFLPKNNEKEYEFELKEKAPENFKDLFLWIFEKKYIEEEKEKNDECEKLFNQILQNYVLDSNYKNNNIKLTTYQIAENIIVTNFLNIEISGLDYFLKSILSIQKNFIPNFIQFIKNDTTKDKEIFLTNRKEEFEKILKLFYCCENYEIINSDIDTAFFQLATTIYVYLGIDNYSVRIFIRSLIKQLIFIVFIQEIILKYNEKTLDFSKVSLDLLEDPINLCFLKPMLKKTVGFMLCLLSNKEITNFINILRSEYFLESDINELECYLNLFSINFDEIKEYIKLQEIWKNGKFNGKISYFIKRMKKPLLFEFIDLPEDFNQLVENFLQIKCSICKNYSQLTELALCLICGLVLCTSKCTTSKEIGNLNQHSQEVHSNQSIFISLKNGKLILVASPKNYISKTIYFDLFGQEFKWKSNMTWDKFKLDKNILSTLKEKLITNSIAQEITYNMLKEGLSYQENVL